MHDIIDMAYRIYNKCQFAGSAHYKASDIATKKHTSLGVPVVILTSIVAASVFKSASTMQSEPMILFATGFISLYLVDVLKL